MKQRFSIMKENAIKENENRHGESPDRMKRKTPEYYLAASISLMTFLVYLPCLRNDFVNWDDNAYVFANPHIRSLDLPFFRWAFFRFYADNWHPLTWVSHAVDYTLWGLQPAGHHLTNIILHAVNTFLVVLLAAALAEAGKEQATKKYPQPTPDRQSPLIVGGVTGMLFGLHPLHVESVAWVAERKDLLCALFFLLSIISYARYAAAATGEAVRGTSQPSFVKRRYLLFTVFAFFALLSKPMAVSLPLVFLLLDWHPYRRIHSIKTFLSSLAEKLPVLAMCLVSSVLTIFAQRAGGTVVSIQAIPLSTRLLVAAKSLTAYLWKMLLPVNLLPYYPYPRSVSFLSFEYLLAIGLLLLITLSCLLAAGKRKEWLTVWGYYVATLLPVIGIFQVGNQSMADRYTYLPGLGPFFAAGLAAAWIWEKTTILEKGKGARSALVTLGVLLPVAFSSLTLVQMRVWKDDLSLWNYVIEKEPGRLFFAYNNRAEAYSKRGNYNQAIADYSEAIALDDHVAGLYNNRGTTYAAQSRYDLARADFEKAIEVGPQDASGYYNMACLYSLRNNAEEACKWLQKTVLMGFRNWEQIKQDSDFDNIRSASCYREIMKGR
jgi:tetratricopeptide (TPR) repeat protein